jgi:hypothetical protein
VGAWARPADAVLRRSDEGSSRRAIALLDRAFGKPAQSVNSSVTRIDPDSISDAELASYLTDADATEDSGAEAPPKTRRQKKPH